MKKYSFYVSYFYSDGINFGFGSVTMFYNNPEIPIKQMQDDLDLMDDTKKITIINVCPSTIKGTKTRGLD